MEYRTDLDKAGPQGVKKGLLLKITVLLLHSWQNFKKKETTEKTGQEKKKTGKSKLTYCYTACEFLERGGRKDGKALHNLLSFCLHTSPLCLHKQPPLRDVNQPFNKALTNAATCLRKLVVQNTAASNHMKRKRSHMGKRQVKGSEKEGTRGTKKTSLSYSYSFNKINFFTQMESQYTSYITWISMCVCNPWTWPSSHFLHICTQGEANHEIKSHNKVIKEEINDKSTLVFCLLNWWTRGYIGKTNKNRKIEITFSVSSFCASLVLSTSPAAHQWYANEIYAA